MELRFINNNAPLDRRSQRLVRNHAMKGKNLGRTIPARGHRGQQHRDGIRSDRLMAEPKRATDVDTKRLLLPKASRTGDNPDVTLTPNPFSGAELAYFTSPVALTSSDRYLFYEFHYSVSKELYPRVFCHQPDGNEIAWFERVIEDPCVFHCAMAVTRARISQAQGHSDRTVAAKHLLLALRGLRHDLGSNSKPRNSTIAVTISLAIYANLSRSTNESRTHLEGLRRIFELRPGGLAAFCSRNPEMGNKIRRCDQELALLAGTRTIFGSQPLPQPSLPCVVPVDGQMPRPSLPPPVDETGSVIRFSMIDALELCNYAGKSQLGALQYQGLVISIIQRLIDYTPLSGRRPLHILDDVCQLGLLAFMSTLLNQTREAGHSCSELLSNSLRASLDRFDDEAMHDRAKEYLSLYLWLMFIYAVSALDYKSPRGDLFVTQRIRNLANRLALKTWDDVATLLGFYPWVDAFHTEPSKKLWTLTCNS